MSNEQGQVSSVDPTWTGSLVVLRQKLEEAESLPELTSLVDQAEVLRVAAQRARLSAEVQNDWAEYKLDAQRKAGQALADLEEQGKLRKDGRPKTVFQENSFPGIQFSYEELGVGTRARGLKWQQLASLDDDVYESYKADTRCSGKEITEAGALRIAKHQQRESRKYEQASEVAAAGRRRASRQYSTFRGVNADREGSARCGD